MCRINFAGSIESGGVKMIYLPYFILSLQWKHLCNFLVDTSPSLCHYVEKSFVNEDKVLRK